MTRLSLLTLWAALAFAQIPEPPEEDISPSQKKEYTFNPLQAVKEIRIGNFYFKKGSYNAAVRRFEEAIKWDPNSAEAHLRLGDTFAKLRKSKESAEAYRKFLELQPEGKEADAVRKKVK